MFKRVSISLTIMKEKGSAEFDLQNEIVLNHSFCSASASSNTSSKALNIFHDFDKASSIPRETSYLDIHTSLWTSPQSQSGSPLASRFTTSSFDRLFSVPKLFTLTLDSRSKIIRWSSERRASLLVENIHEEDLNRLRNEEVVSAEKAVEENGKRRRVAIEKERAWWYSIILGANDQTWSIIERCS